MAKVKFHSDFCEAGEIKFAAGKTYPETTETTRCIALGFAELIKQNKKEMEAEAAEALRLQQEAEAAQESIAAGDTPSFAE